MNTKTSRKQVLPNSAVVGKIRPDGTKRLFQDTRRNSKSSEESLISTHKGSCFAEGDGFKIASKRGFTNSRAMGKCPFNGGKNAKSKMGRAIKKDRPGRGQIS
jgi:hypothetical protein